MNTPQSQPPDYEQPAPQVPEQMPDMPRRALPEQVNSPAPPELDDLLELDDPPEHFPPPTPRPPPVPKTPRSQADFTEDDLPDSDGKPMFDSEFQADAVIYVREGLRDRYRLHGNVTIQANMFLYYPTPPGWPKPRSGRPSCVTPDCMVSFGVSGRVGRKSYVVAHEGLGRTGKVPDFVLEVASDCTWKIHYHKKRRIYEAIGVGEYLIFDSREKPRFESRVLGLRLGSDGRYCEIPAEPMPGGGEGVYIRVLDLHAHARGRELRLRTAEGVDLRTPSEEAEGRRIAEQECDEAARAWRKDALWEEALRKDVQARRLAEQQRDEEARKRREVERQLAEMQARLDGSQGGTPPKPAP